MNANIGGNPRAAWQFINADSRLFSRLVNFFSYELLTLQSLEAPYQG